MRILLGSAILSTSFLLLHCSSDDSDDGGKAGTGGTGAVAGSSTAGSGGASGASTAGKGGTGATGTAGTGPTGSGGTGPTGAGGTGPTGSGGTGPTGAGGTGPTGSGGTGPTGAGGTGPTGSGGTGAGGAAAGSSTSGGASGAGAGGAAGSSGGSGGAAAFSLTSSALAEGAMFAEENTCASGDGFGSSPPLTWTAGPSGTMSYAIVLIDNDYMDGFIHWVMWDIPATVTTLPADLPSGMMPSMPAGAKQRNLQTDHGYAGPCPSGMDHEYTFTVYALPSATLAGTTGTTMQVVAAIEAANPLAEASLSGHSTAARPD